MSIIHEALKKVQQSMKLGKPQNPEDVVEVLPSSNPSSSNSPEPGKPKGSLLRSLLIIVFCLVLIGVSLFFGLRQVKEQYPNFLSNVKLPANKEIKAKIEEALKKNPMPELKMPTLKPRDPNAKPNEPSSEKAKEVPAGPTHFITPEPPVETPSAEAVEETVVMPMVEQEEAVVVNTLVNVQGIMSQSNGSNVALINNNVYEEGSIVKGVKILKINAHDVVVEYNGKEETLSVNK